MQNKKLVRLQLVVLAALTVGVVARVMIGPGSPEGLIVISDLESAELTQTSFRLDRAEPFSIDAVGSLEERFDAQRPVPALATYGWILDRSTRDVVWKMDPTNVQVEGPTLARTTTTLTLGPGDYDAYFTTYGNSKASREQGNVLKTLFGRHWTADAGEWRLVLTTMLEDGETGLVPLSDDEARMWPLGEGQFWSTGSMEDHDKAEYVFRVDQPTTFRLYSVGEICRRNECDYGWIEEAFTRERLWELNEAASARAGGMLENRVGRQELALTPGLYRAAFKTDGGHAYDDWIANPPYDPPAWGLSLFLTEDADPSVVGPYDPWKAAEPALRINRVANDEHRQLKFAVSDTARIVIHAAGELRRSGNRYDYGWLQDDASNEKVWEMSWESSYPGGGHRGNREETAFVSLAPGTYSLNYQTDDSHAYGTWSNGRPEHPERWGVAVFPFGESTNVQLVEDAKAATAARVTRAPRSPTAGRGSTPGKVILDARGLGNDRSVEQRFTLDSASRLRVVAVGEMSVSGRYDYGWLESESGTTVWEMTYPETEPAGGDDRNRKFDGVIELPAGTYVVRFVTDFSHARGDFGEDAPAEPSAWGILVQSIQ